MSQKRNSINIVLGLLVLLTLLVNPVKAWFFFGGADAAGGGSGTVTSVNIAGDNGALATGGPITTSGTMTVSIDQGQILAPHDIGASVQAWDTHLDEIAALTPGAEGRIISSDGLGSWTVTTPSAGSSEWTDNGGFLIPADGVTEKIVVGYTTNGVGAITNNGSISFVASTEPTNPMTGSYAHGELYFSSVDNNLHFLTDNTGTWNDVDLFAFGDVNGSGATTNNAIAVWSGTTGKLIQNSPVTVDPTYGSIAGADSISLAGSMSNPLVVSTSALVVNTSGNVGIGTASPDQTFKVQRDMYTDNEIYLNNNKFLKWEDSGAMSSNSIIGVNSSDEVVIQSFAKYMGGQAPIVFKPKSGPAEAARFDGNGNLGINENTPTALLEVNGSTFFRDEVYFSFVNDGNGGTSKTIDWSTGLYHKLTMTGNCTFTFTAPTRSTTVTLKLTQDATGSRTATWPASVKWAGGTAPTLSTGNADIDFIRCIFDNGATAYYCQEALDFF